jgi:uncharacterized protein with FMN-binding domain
MMKRFPVLSGKKMRPYAALAVLSLVFAACPNNPPEEKDNRHAPYGSPPYSGQVTGEANGTHQGGPTTIKLTLTLEEGYITSVGFDGSTGITEGIGSRVRDQAPAQIIAANSFNDDVIDAFSGATVTRTTTIAAGKKALNTIPGVNVE